MKTKMLSCVLAATVSINMINTIVVSADTTQEKIDKLENEKNQINSEKTQVTNELQELYTKISEKLSEIDKVQQIVDGLQSEINELEVDITSLNEQIIEKEEAIVENTLEYEKKIEEESKQKELLRQRLRRNYINNTYNEFLAIILDSSSLSEISLKLKVINNIFNNDKKIINDLKEIQKNLEETRLSLETTKKDLSDNKLTLEAKQKSLLEKQGIYLEQKAALDSQYESLESIENAKQAKIKELEQRQQKIELDIHDLLNPKEDIEYDTSVGSGIYSMFIKPTSGTITSKFGYRVDPITGAAGNNHTGLDIANSFGTSIRAAASGTVTFAGWNSGGYGKFVIIDHGNGIVTRYAHNQNLLVSVGDYVSQGQVIAEMGSTGYSTGSHLHFEIKINGKFVDPLPVYQ